MMGARVLLAEDDRSVREALSRALELEGHIVEAVSDGGTTLDALHAHPPDVVILDWMMPVLDGLSVCRAIRAEGDRVPVLILTARGDVRDRVAGLDAGADDYLPKPFALDELLARVRALLRRTLDGGVDGPAVQVGDLSMEPSARQAWRGDRELDLTKTEYDLLEVLARNAGIVCTHAMIYDRVWGYDFGPDSKALAVYIGYLRRKLEEAGEARIIHTVRGVGYTVRAP
jgi:two-component system, OmpR family, response regulator MprA